MASGQGLPVQQSRVQLAREQSKHRRETHLQNNQSGVRFAPDHVIGIAHSLEGSKVRGHSAVTRSGPCRVPDEVRFVLQVEKVWTQLGGVSIEAIKTAARTGRVTYSAADE